MTTLDRIRILPALFVLMLGLWPLLVEGAALMRFVTPPPEALAELGELLEAGSPVAILAILVAAPVLEEALFRGLLLRGLAVWLPRALGLFVTAALFGAAHANLYQLVPAFSIGLLFGWVYLATGSIFLPILAHMFWNAQPFVFASLPWLDDDADAADAAGATLEAAVEAFPIFPAWWLLLSAAVAAAGGVLLWRALPHCRRAWWWSRSRWRPPRAPDLVTAPPTREGLP